MLRQLAVLIGLIALMSAGGCGGGNAPSAKSASQPAVPVQLKIPEQPGDHDVEVERAAEASSPPAAEAPKVATAALKTKVADRGGSEADLVERIAILTPGGPLLVDVRLTIDGRPHKEAFDARVNKSSRPAIPTPTADRPGASWRPTKSSCRLSERRCQRMPSAEATCGPSDST